MRDTCATSPGGATIASMADPVIKKAVVFKNKTERREAERKANRWAKANPGLVNKGAGKQVFSCWLRFLIEEAA